MSKPYGITLDPAWIAWAAKEKVSETVAAAVLLICQNRPAHEVVAKLTPWEFERVVDIVRRSPDHFPFGTLAALNSPRPIPASPKQSASFLIDRDIRQRPVGIASPDTSLGAQRPLDAEAKPGNSQAPHQRLARTSPDTLRERQARAIRAAPGGLHRTHERRFNSVRAPQTASKLDPTSAAEPDRAVTPEKAGTHPGTLADILRRRMVVEDLNGLGLSIRGIAAATGIPRSSVHRAVRAMARARAKQEADTIQIMKKLLGKRLSRQGERSSG